MWHGVTTAWQVSEARALLKREVECCSDRPEKVNCQPGLFGRGMFREAT